MTIKYLVLKYSTVYNIFIKSNQDLLNKAIELKFNVIFYLNCKSEFILYIIISEKS